MEKKKKKKKKKETRILKIIEYYLTSSPSPYNFSFK